MCNIKSNLVLLQEIRCDVGLGEFMLRLCFIYLLLTALGDDFGIQTGLEPCRSFALRLSGAYSGKPTHNSA